MKNKEIRNKGKLKRLAKKANKTPQIKLQDLLHELNIYKAVLFALAEHNNGEFQVKIGIEKGNIATHTAKDADGNWIITVRSSKENSSVQ
jgi:hypothetical protein